MANQAFNVSGVVGGASLAFKTISTNTQTDIVADSSASTLTLSAMGNFEVQHHASTDTIILSGGAGGAGGSTINAFDVMMISEVYR